MNYIDELKERDIVICWECGLTDAETARMLGYKYEDTIAKFRHENEMEANRELRQSGMFDQGGRPYDPCELIAKAQARINRARETANG